MKSSVLLTVSIVSPSFLGVICFIRFVPSDDSYMETPLLLAIAPIPKVLVGSRMVYLTIVHLKVYSRRVTWMCRSKKINTT